MNYSNPTLLERLAAEHVLGTLRGPARRRFERLCQTSPLALGAVRRWEDDLSALAWSLPPVQPSVRVWAGIRGTLFATDEPAKRARRQRRWGFAVAASLVAVGLLVTMIVREPPVELQTVAVLGADTAHPVWKIERHRELTALSIRVVGAVERRPGKSYELWALPRGGNPVSLGLLPAGGTLERTLTARQREALLAADKVAVSVEPELGSPTGSPTGPVILVGSLALSG